MTYQDKWLRGRVIQRGERECAERYELVRAFCSRFNDRPFTVCDIGANWCYFGLRLASDFPACTVIAWEFHDFERKAAHLRANNEPRVRLFRRRLTLNDVRALTACCHFDVVLALSVLHHLPGDHDEWVAALRGLGRHLILEHAIGDSRVRGRGHEPLAADVTQNATILGGGASHIKRGARRPILTIPGVVA